MISLTKYKAIKDYRTIFCSILVGFSFLLLTLITVKTFAPEVKSEAANQTASQTVGPYTMSMSNDSVATVNITPTDSQTIYTGTNNLSVTNTCDAGATITMATNSTTSNSLTRSATNSDNLAKDIVATTTTGLDNNSWGYALNNSSTYYAVPKKGATAATVYNATAAQTSALTVPIKFGVKTDNNMPSGTYTNDVIYTMTPKSGCLSYSVTWNYDGGTAKSGATYPTSIGWGQTVNLSTLTPTKDGYTFAGWTNGTSTFTGSETAANLNSANAKSITVTAKWQSNDPPIPAGACSGSYGGQDNINLAVNGTKTFDYTGNVRCAYLQKAGYYKLEVWGAQGGQGSYYTTVSGGFGGYSYGNIYSNSNSSIYIVVGAKGSDNSQSGAVSGGYNGGGSGGFSTGGDSGGGGGGATHIATVSGLLSSLSSSDNQAKVLIVAGGGGGGSSGQHHGDGLGGSGGGYVGGDGQYSAGDGNSCRAGGGGSQSSGGYVAKCNNSEGTASGFGLGSNASSNSSGGGGGGGGWYGGGSGNYQGGSYTGHGGGGGSGYIGNSLLLGTKRMYCYTGNTTTACSASTSVATYTVGTSSTGHAVANAANTGNGYAKITYLGTSI